MTLINNNNNGYSNGGFVVVGGESSYAIATAFRDAAEEDTRNALNAMSQPHLVSTLKYYLVPCSWMTECLSYLEGKTEERPTAEIQNQILTRSNTIPKEALPVSDDDDEDDSRRQQKHQQPVYSAPAAAAAASATANSNGTLSTTLKITVQHGIDFYCVGFNVWQLVSNKFGYDIELCYKVVPNTGGILSIQLPNRYVDIPASGRFDYVAAAAGADNNVVKTDVVSDEDEDDLFPTFTSDLSKKVLPYRSRYDLKYKVNTTAEEQKEDEEDPIMSTRSPTCAASHSSNNAIILLPSSNAIDNDDDDMDLELGGSPVRNSTLKRKRYGSGLGNLGNTCFMNSTLQCLAHTEPLRRYFCSGDYRRDLNKDNPLGTGGELATQFARLLCEMWGSKLPSTPSPSYNTSVVYPRDFKQCLGKHAEQFLGYDQHDSQELATYLLDALHEDTNRVTKKPYIEKPEQGQDEADDVASRKAWHLHLQREDSKVLENFMGQVKSRVQCPSQGCGRISTTFDPFMYLSVPIPGATDRTVKVTLVPLEGGRKALKVSLHKNSTIAVLKQKIIEQWAAHSHKTIAMQDLILKDIWNGEIFAGYADEDPVDKIRETDVTFAYQLMPIAELAQPEEAKANDVNVDDDSGDKPQARTRPNRIMLNADTRTFVNVGTKWQDELGVFVRSSLLIPTFFNPKRINKGSLMRLYDDLGVFLDDLYEALEKTKFDDEVEAEDPQDDEMTEKDRATKSCKALEDVSFKSSRFHNVTTRADVALLDFIEKKLRNYILGQEDRSKQFSDGVIVGLQFCKREYSTSSTLSNEKGFTQPLVVRLPPKMKVFEFREYLSKRLPLKDDGPPAKLPAKSDDAAVQNSNNSNGHHSRTAASSGDPDLLVLRQIPMTCGLKTPSYGYRSYPSKKQLGKLQRQEDSNLEDQPPIHLADANDAEEQQDLASVLTTDGSGHQINLYWTEELCERHFDKETYEKDEVLVNPEEVNKQEDGAVTVFKCIEKFCQMEQLEETEMWYCNQCKEHVRAWKQFHIYRSPPILIVHLKRFHYSASTHRRDKIDIYVDFPLAGLDLTKQVMHWDDGEKPIYDCYAVSNHYGGLGGGHYTAYALNDDGSWCYYDDSRITTDVDPKEVVSNAAYVLYYKRRDVVFSTPEFEAPYPAIIQDCENETNGTNMDLDGRVPSSPTGSNTSTTPMVEDTPPDEDDYFSRTDYESDHLPIQHDTN